MRVKKLLALALAGALSASMLAGCNRTLIEHQFHIDSVTNTETAVQMVDSNFALNLKRLNDLLKQHGASLYHSPNADFQYFLAIDFEEGPVSSEYREAILEASTITDERLDDLLSGCCVVPNYFMVTSEFEADSENDFNNYLKAVSSCILKLYSALESTDLSRYDLEDKVLAFSEARLIVEKGTARKWAACGFLLGDYDTFITANGSAV